MQQTREISFCIPNGTHYQLSGKATKVNCCYFSLREYRDRK